MGESVRKLESDALQTFDHDYVPGVLLERIVSVLGESFPSGIFRFSDIGGGRGFFADRLLERFPDAQCVIVDNADVLLAQNAINERKTLVNCSATELNRFLTKQKFDVVFFNLSLHHFVTPSYRATRKTQRQALEQALTTLKPGGLVIVTENLYNGKIFDNLPGFLINRLTSSKLLAPIIKRLGANTAGCGVCFLSLQTWRSEFMRLGLRELHFEDVASDITTKSFRPKALILGIRSLSRGVFILQP